MSCCADSVLTEGERIVDRAAAAHWKFLLSHPVGVHFLLAAPGACFAIGNNAGASLAMVAIPLVIGVAAILCAVIRARPPNWS